MHHVALDGTGAHDRHLDHEIVEGARLEPRQHVHLCAALDLEHADRICTAEHVVDGRVLARDVGERQVLAVVGLDEIEGAVDAAQHAEGEHIDLQ